MMAIRDQTSSLIFRFIGSRLVPHGSKRIHLHLLYAMEQNRDGILTYDRFIIGTITIVIYSPVRSRLIGYSQPPGI